MITPLKKIIVCLDHTQKDKLLIENACELSKIAGTEEIIFLNIIKDFNLPDDMIKEFPNLFDQAVEERRAELNELVDAHFKCDIKTRNRTNHSIIMGYDCRHSRLLRMEK